MTPVTPKAPTRSAAKGRARPARKSAPDAASPPQPITVLRARSLAQSRWLVHGFSTRLGGTSKAYGGDALNLAFIPGDSRAAVLRNRKRFLAAVIGQTPASGHSRRRLPLDFPLITLKQVHSSRVHVIDSDVEADANRPLTGDGLITAMPGVMLAIQTADCVPVLVADKRRRVIAAFHAGWRGTAARVVEKGIGVMRAHFGCRTQDLVAAIGPCIRSCCYSVGPEVVEEFTSQFEYAAALFHDVYDLDPIKRKYPMLFLTARAPGHSNLGPQTHLDLVEANRRQLLAAGMPLRNIEEMAYCTACRTDLLFSHRAEAGYAGRMLAVIGIKPPAAAERRR